MTNYSKCVKCQGEKYSSNCIIWEGKTIEFEDFNSLIEYLYDNAKKADPIIDLKTLSNSNQVSIAEAVQLLIDKEVQRVYQTSNSNTSTTCDLNITQLDSCSNCDKSFCEKLQLMVDEIILLKAEVNQLKAQI